MPNRTTNARHTQATKTMTSSSLAALPLSLSSITKIAQRLPWEISEGYCSKTITARSRRKRHSQQHVTRPAEVDVAATNVACASMDAELKHNLHSSNSNGHSLQLNSTLHRFTQPAYTILNGLTTLYRSHPTSIAAYITLLMLTATCSFCAASPCDTQSWWDPVKDKCISCTVCHGEMIPLRPCQIHRDTICGSIYDLKIDWVVLAKTEPNWKERRKSDNIDFNLEQQLTPEELQQLQEETIPLDWQTAALFLAVLACLIFFIIAACILLQHMRQWRRMERRLDQDVEELSTKLMAKLAEVQSLEGGTFFIGNADALRVPTTFQPQHVLLPEKPVKQHERRLLQTLQPGNVYIEENGSKG